MAHHHPGGAGRGPRRLLAVQLILVTVVLSAKVNGVTLGKLSKSVGRSFMRAPSMVLDGGQYATQKVAGALGNAAQPIGLKGVVDATGGAVSNLLGATSRLFGKPTNQPKTVRFLYSRPLNRLGTSPKYQKAIRMVLGHALTNVVLFRKAMVTDADRLTAVNADDMPILCQVVDKLRAAGAPREDLRHIVYLLGRNGTADIPRKLKPEILGTLKDQYGRFKPKGLIEEIRWIAERPTGFYNLSVNETTDYNMKTRYSKYDDLYPLSLEPEN